MLSSCAQFQSVPSSPQQPSVYNHPYVPQSAEPIVQATVQATRPVTTETKEEQFIMQLDTVAAEAEAYIQAGEARLLEHDVLGAVREFERARIVIEQDLDPTLSQVRQQVNVQGGMNTLSTSHIQKMTIQRADMLSRINRSYDFREMADEQKAFDKFSQLRDKSKLTPMPMSSSSSSVETSRRIQVQEKLTLIPVPLVRPEINGELVADVDRNILLFQRRHDDFLNCLLRADRHFPQITSILATEGVPGYLAYIALLESGYQPLALSLAGKAGLWQFSSSLARQYGLRVSSSVDERFNIDASTRAFARYMTHLYRQFGSWELVIIRFSSERDYLAKLIAATKIANDPRLYGFYVDLPNMTGLYIVQRERQQSGSASSTMLLGPPASTLY